MPSPFVQTEATTFKWNGAPFPLSGVNCYFLGYCNDESRRAAMTKARSMGATVIRSWAFLAINNFTPGRVAFQYFKDGRIHVNDGPEGLQRLDALIKAAEDLDIKLILPLVNHWQALGGMPTYIDWLSTGSDVSEFYRAPVLRAAYQDWVHQILTRRNSITGRLYSEEPAIMAWELTNEARCPVQGGRELLLAWIAEMAAFVKERDSNHLLALGDEGFFYEKGLGDLYDGSHGVDWEANLAVSEIDFGTYHYFPQDWGLSRNLDFATHWIEDHYVAAARLNKPAVMEEFGLKLDSREVATPQDRNRWFGRWLNTVKDTGTAGSLLWMLGHKAPDTDGYTDDFVIYEPGEVPALAAGTRSTAE